MSKRKWKLPAMSLLLFWCFWQMEPWPARFLRLRGTSHGTFQSSTAQPSTIQASTTWSSTTPLSSVRPSIPQASTAQPRQVAPHLR